MAPGFANRLKASNVNLVQKYWLLTAGFVHYELLKNWEYLNYKQGNLLNHFSLASICLPFCHFRLLSWWKWFRIYELQMQPSLRTEMVKSSWWCGVFEEEGIKKLSRDLLFSKKNNFDWNLLTSNVKIIIYSISYRYELLSHRRARSPIVLCHWFVIRARTKREHIYRKCSDLFSKLARFFIWQRR